MDSLKISNTAGRVRMGGWVGGGGRKGEDGRKGWGREVGGRVGNGRKDVL